MDISQNIKINVLKQKYRNLTKNIKNPNRVRRDPIFQIQNQLQASCTSRQIYRLFALNMFLLTTGNFLEINSCHFSDFYQCQMLQTRH